MDKEFPDMPFNWGIFGENLTTGSFSNLRLAWRYVSNRKCEGSCNPVPYALLQAWSKFGKMDIVKKFLESGKSGIYFKVVKKGKIGMTDDSLHLIKKDNNDVPIENIVEIVTEDKNNKLLVEKVVKVQDLPSCWKHYFLEKLSHLNKIKNCT